MSAPDALEIRRKNDDAAEAAPGSGKTHRVMIGMDLNQIRYFLVLCDELHFTRAAKRCGISQPSLTNSIRALEAEVGGQLFHRKPTPRLSELGRFVRPRLRRALTAIELALSAGKSRPRGQDDPANAPNPGSRRRSSCALRPSPS